jgi:YD repeat-containing protein
VLGWVQDSGVWLGDLSSVVPNGRLVDGASTSVATFAIYDSLETRPSFRAGLLAMPYPNAAPLTVRFGVSDPFGLSDTTDVRIHVANVDRAPTLAVSNHAALVGQPLTFQLVGSDPDSNTTLSYSAFGMPFGATLDSVTGQFRWTPNPAQVGDYVVTFTVTDGSRVASRAVLLRSTLTPVPPSVIVELTPSFPAVPGQAVLVHAAASSIAPITGITVQIGGQSIALDSQGRATYVPQAPGRITIEAQATDADGLVGHFTAVLKVRDPNDQTAPVVAFDPRFRNATLSTATDLTGTVRDTNLDYWVLEQAPIGSNSFTELARGNAPVANGVLASFDPASLPNGSYLLRLTAVDISGRMSQTQVVVEANTVSKPTQYLRTDTDLTVQLGGATVTITRTYDSLAKDQAGAFGFGWRFANRESDIQTNVAPTGHEATGVYNPFRIGTRVYLTLPDGRRVGFTFEPQSHDIPGLTYYTPAYQADAGVDYTLSSAATLLTLADDRLYDLKTGQPYNPASGAFTDPEYTLTAPDGTQYRLSTAHGVEEEIRPDGTHLTYSDSGITGANGDTLQFIHDDQGRLSKLIAPDGTQVIYTYDSFGNLIAARNLALGQSKR